MKSLLTISIPMDQCCDVSQDTFKRVIQLFIDYPEYFTMKSVSRADIMHVANGQLRRRLIPRLHRCAEGNSLLQQIEMGADGRSCRFILIGTVEQLSLQFFHPIVRWFCVELADDVLLIRVEKFATDELADGFQSPTSEIEMYRNKILSQDECINEYFTSLGSKLAAIIRKETTNGVYEKRVHHDKVIPKHLFQDLYYGLKATLGEECRRMWLDSEMTTDFEKHGHEDMLIATFLILLFAKHHSSADNYPDGESGKRFELVAKVQKMMKGVNSELAEIDFASALSNVLFVDMGCGNGLLAWVLTKLGVEGYGVDIWERPLWRHLQSSCPAVDIRLSKVVPSQFEFEFPESVKTEGKTVWLIGNHSDELTPWIPLIAHNQTQKGYRCQFMVIPCCFHDLHGYKNTPARWHFRLPSLSRDYQDSEDTISDTDDDELAKPEPVSDECKSLDGRYANYLHYIQQIMTTIGYQKTIEHLRIPSTKNVCLIGTIPKYTNSDVIDASGNDGMDEKKGEFWRASDAVEAVLESVPFRCRLSDREKTLLKFEKERSKKLILQQQAGDGEASTMWNSDEMSGFMGMDLF